RYLDGRAYGLNMGLVGVGSDNARGTFDNLVVQTNPPQATFDGTEDFTTGAGRFTGGSGSWSVGGGRLSGSAGGTAPALDVMDIPVRAAGVTTTTVGSTVRLSGGASAGWVFDHYNAKDYKFVTFDQASGVVTIGHVTKKQRVVDQTFAATLGANTDLGVVLTLRGTTVTVSLGGVEIGSFSYDAMVGDGAIGALVERGSSTFDDVHVVIGVPVTTSPDLVPPTLSVPPDVTRSATSGATSLYVSDATIGTATATDNIPRTAVLVTRSGVPDGNLFALGTTTITWTATDVFGNQSTRTQTVTVTATAPTPPTVTIAVTDAAGAESGSDPIVFTATRTGSTTSSLAVTVGWGGTASGADYSVSVTGGTLVGSVLTIAAGSSTATITVRPVDDTTAEPTETATLTLFAGVGYTTTGTTTVSGSIADNDAPPPPVTPTLSIADATVLEGASPGYVVLTISLSSPAPSGGVTVQVRTSNGSADTKDYSTVNQSVTIAAGQSGATVTVWITNDNRREGTETFTVTLSSPVRATIADATAVVTILDDESALLADALGSGTASESPSRLQVAVGRRTAVTAWAAAGLDTRGLASAPVRVTDLPGALVGYSSHGGVWLDLDAAGHGWGPGGYDLVAVLIHELGHVLGLDHAQLDRALQLMGPTAPSPPHSAPATAPAPREGALWSTHPAPGDVPRTLVRAGSAHVPDAVARPAPFAPVRPAQAPPALRSAVRSPISVPAAHVSTTPPARDTAYLLWWLVAVAAVVALGQGKRTSLTSATTPITTIRARSA
ncbi:MAG: Calx-beta domain-containing protein, partial [Ornithinibacter sp.]